MAVSSNNRGEYHPESTETKTPDNNRKSPEHDSNNDSSDSCVSDRMSGSNLISSHEDGSKSENSHLSQTESSDNTSSSGEITEQTGSSSDFSSDNSDESDSPSNTISSSSSLSSDGSSLSTTGQSGLFAMGNGGLLPTRKDGESDERAKRQQRMLRWLKRPGDSDTEDEMKKNVSKTTNDSKDIKPRTISRVVPLSVADPAADGSSSQLDSGDGTDDEDIGKSANIQKTAEELTLEKGGIHDSMSFRELERSCAVNWKYRGRVASDKREHTVRVTRLLEIIQSKMGYSLFPEGNTIPLSFYVDYEKHYEYTGNRMEDSINISFIHGGTTHYYPVSLLHLHSTMLICSCQSNVDMMLKNTLNFSIERWKNIFSSVVRLVANTRVMLDMAVISESLYEIDPVATGSLNDKGIMAEDVGIKNPSEVHVPLTNNPGKASKKSRKQDITKLTWIGGTQSTRLHALQSVVELICSLSKSLTQKLETFSMMDHEYHLLLKMEFDLLLLCVEFFSQTEINIKALGPVEGRDHQIAKVAQLIFSMVYYGDNDIKESIMNLLHNKLTTATKNELARFLEGSFSVFIQYFCQRSMTDATDYVARRQVEYLVYLIHHYSASDCIPSARDLMTWVNIGGFIANSNTFGTLVVSNNRMCCEFALGICRTLDISSLTFLSDLTEANSILQELCMTGRVADLLGQNSAAELVDSKYSNTTTRVNRGVSQMNFPLHKRFDVDYIQLMHILVGSFLEVPNSTRNRVLRIKGNSSNHTVCNHTVSRILNSRTLLYIPAPDKPRDYGSILISAIIGGDILTALSCISKTGVFEASYPTNHESQRKMKERYDYIVRLACLRTSLYRCLHTHASHDLRVLSRKFGLPLELVVNIAKGDITGDPATYKISRDGFLISAFDKKSHFSKHFAETTDVSLSTDSSTLFYLDNRSCQYIAKSSMATDPNPNPLVEEVPNP